MSNDSGYFRGVVTGLLFGAAAALLLAPKPGSEADKQTNDAAAALKDKAEDFSASVSEVAQSLKERGTDFLESAKEQLEPTVEDAAQDAAQDATQKARTAAAQVDNLPNHKNHAHDVVDSV
jgi:gas vesicle protein